MSKEPTRREEAESNEDKAKQAQKQGDDATRSDAVRRTEQQQTGIPQEAIVDPGTPSINEPPGSDVIPPETKKAVEQANKDLEAQAQNAAKQTAQQQQQPGSEQEIADRREKLKREGDVRTGSPPDDEKGKRR